jgi:hypothetical protein
VFKTRTPPPPFPLSLVVDLTKEALKEWSSKVVVVLGQVLTQVDVVPGYKVRRLAWLKIYVIRALLTRTSGPSPSRAALVSSGCIVAAVAASHRGLLLR